MALKRYDTNMNCLFGAASRKPNERKANEKGVEVLELPPERAKVSCLLLYTGNAWRFESGRNLYQCCTARRNRCLFIRCRELEIGVPTAQWKHTAN